MGMYLVQMSKFEGFGTSIFKLAESFIIALASQDKGNTERWSKRVERRQFYSIWLI